MVRALERAVLQRKNALFYRTLNGAQAGDLFMSLIHTCQLCGANSFDYLIELQRHAQNWRPSPRSGCRGTIARRWSGSCPSPIPRRVMRNRSWPETIAKLLSSGSDFRKIAERTLPI
jgi:hypothetical protein